MKKKKIGIVSLGCPKNLVDSETMAGRLARAGYEFTADEDRADLVLINTCGFIDTAKEESIDTILSFTRRRLQGDLKGLLVTGCLAQRYAGELAREIPEVDRFLLIQEEAGIVEAVKGILGNGRDSGREEKTPSAGRSLLTPLPTAYLKISEGCSNGCTYCTIPMIRGPHVSREVPDLLDEARDLCARGVRELVIIGQDITRFGYDRGAEVSLVSLLTGLSGIENLTWIRLMYVHPDHLTRELADLMASASRIVPYLDLPIQHIHPTVLTRMNRKGDGGAIREKIQELREAVPDLVLRTSLIVGFPGETEEAFRELCGFVEEARFDHIGVFTYSREEGTPAAGYPDQLSDAIKTGRRDKILGLQAGISEQKNRARVGSVLPVLVEGRSPDTDLLLSGRYYGQAPEIDGVVLINKGNAAAGAFHDVRITDAHTYDLVGEIVE